MAGIFGWGARSGAALNENRDGPWGPSSGGGDGDDESPESGRRSPWSQIPRKRRTPGAPGGVPSIDEFFRRGRERFGGRFPHQEGRPYWLYGLGVFILLWLLFTSFHLISPQERGVVTLFGRYSRTVSPGIAVTLPLPIERVEKVDVGQVRTTDVGADANAENLILTGDSNIIDLAYRVRWTIRDPQLYLYQLQEPDPMIREVAESAVRAVVATVSLNDAIGAGRSDIEQRVALVMQQVLDAYRAGVRIEGVSVKQSDPPAAVTNAFKEVSAAQQDAQTYYNQARAYSQQVTARAQGDAASFDKVYEQYRLAPEVTRRRMYYETMERVLSKVDKTVVEANGVTSYLPLPQLQKQAEGAAR